MNCAVLGMCEVRWLNTLRYFKGLASVMPLNQVSASVTLMLEGPCGLVWVVLMWDKVVVRTVSEPPPADCMTHEAAQL